MAPDNTVSSPRPRVRTRLACSPWSGGITESTAQVKAQTLNGYTPVSIHYSTDFALVDQMIVSGISDKDGWVTFNLTGLTPDTQYYYALRTHRGVLELDKEGKFKTHPPVGQPASFRFAASSCAGEPPDDETINPGRWPVAASRISNHPVFLQPLFADPLFFAFLGDFHYRNIGDQHPNPRDIYRSIYKTMLMAPNRAKFHREIPLAFMFDNHDAQQAGWPNTTIARVSSGVDPTYRQCVPSYPVEPGKLWQEWKIGRVQFIMPDQRSHRHPGPPTSMMGEEQKEWFKNILVTTDAELIIWLQCDLWTFPDDSTINNSWAPFMEERAELGEFILHAGLSDRLISVTGNMHSSAFHDGQPNQHGGFREFCISGMDTAGTALNHPPTYVGPWDEYSRTYPLIRKYFWGYFDIDDNGERIEVKFTGMHHHAPWATVTWEILTP